MLGEPRLHLLEEDVGVVEAAVDQVDGLAVERVEPRRQRLARHLRGEADRVQDRELAVRRHDGLPPWAPVYNERALTCSGTGC